MNTSVRNLLRAPRISRILIGAKIHLHDRSREGVSAIALAVKFQPLTTAHTHGHFLATFRINFACNDWLLVLSFGCEIKPGYNFDQDISQNQMFRRN
jgi:hypothetical protein